MGVCKVTNMVGEACDVVIVLVNVTAPLDEFVAGEVVE